jgi:hypothetical protein
MFAAHQQIHMKIVSTPYPRRERLNGNSNLLIKWLSALTAPSLFLERKQLSPGARIQAKTGFTTKAGFLRSIQPAQRNGARN